MPFGVVKRVADRMAEHADRHGVQAPVVVLHGGEPLLTGPQGISRVAEALRERVPTVQLQVQTNGTLLDETMVRTLAAHRIKVGVSLDGGAMDNDRHRVFRDGRGTYQDISRSILLLKDIHPELFGGLLSTVDLKADPIACVEGLARFEPPMVDLLLPHGNWSSPPPGLTPDAPYGRWLATVFDHWYGSGLATEIRFFREIITLILGGQSRIESIGLSPVTLLVIDTNGDLEQVDTLRSAYNGAAGTGMNVFRNSFDDALEHPGVMFRQAGTAALAEECLACPVHRVCGGGYYPHRYKQGAGFRQPSVYCRDLRFLIDHIADRVRADLTELLAARL